MGNKSLPCSVDGCGRLRHAREYCRAHVYHMGMGRDPHSIDVSKYRVGIARDDRGRKMCIECLQWLDPDRYSPNSTGADGLLLRCRRCEVAGRYGLSRQELENRILAQDGRCQICGSGLGDKMVIDHDHSCCKKVIPTCGRCNRGILCYRCNTALGMLGDDLGVIALAVDYLEETRANMAPRKITQNENHGGFLSAPRRTLV